MTDIFKRIESATTIGIAGHIRPDGDCVGSCLALYNYLLEQYNKENEKQIDIYLDGIPGEFRFLKNSDKISFCTDQEKTYDVFIVLDSGSLDRISHAIHYFNIATYTYAIDHHISNTMYAMENIVDITASSTCEVLASIFDLNKISLSVAECLYLGIIHDTGVFKHSNTTKKTMQIAGELLSVGVNASKMIDETFYQKTYLQNQVLGRCLLESILVLDGKIIVSNISKKVQEFYDVLPSDLDGAIDQLRVTKGVEVAILLREETFCEYKVSMRSNGVVDVSKIAVFFGGGGHVKAAGCTMKGSLHDVINNLTYGIELQLVSGEKK